MKIILASNSPRRKELIGGLGFSYKVRIKKGIVESYPDDLQPQNVAEYIACQKAKAYHISDDELLITADTVVMVDNEILGKPDNSLEAHEMLKKISGKTHRVFTGVCMMTSQLCRHFSVYTDVTFKELSDSEIDYYIKKYQPFDKAGAYGIQEWIGYIGITAINGSYYNVMGLPVQRIYEELVRNFHFALN